MIRMFGFLALLVALSSTCMAQRGSTFLMTLYGKGGEPIMFPQDTTYRVTSYVLDTTHGCVWIPKTYYPTNSRRQSQPLSMGVSFPEHRALVTHCSDTMVIDFYVHYLSFSYVVDSVQFQPGHYIADLREYSRIYQGVEIRHPSFTASTERGTWLRDLGRGDYFRLFRWCR